MKHKRILGGLALALAGMTALAACSSSGSSSSGSSTPSSSSSASSVKSGGTFTYALDQDIAGFNINQATDSEFVLQEIMNQVWPTVYVIPDSLKPQLDTNYVTSATVTSTSPQTIVYQINPKAVWSDGTPISADDFIYMWQANSGNPKYTDVGGKAFEPASTAGYNQIKSVTSSNGGKTATVVFATPFGDWQSLFSDIMPSHIAKTVGFNNGFQTFNAAVKVSGGPFEIQTYTQGQDLIEVRNPKWWGTPAPLDKLVFRFFADDNQIPPALQNNEANAASPVIASLEFKNALAPIPNLTTTIIPGLQFQHFDFNQANPYLGKLAVRQAIAAGTNRADMVNRIIGPITTSVKPLNNRMYMPNQPQYTDTSGGAGAYDPAKAKQLLQSAGMTMGSDGYFHPSSGPQAGKDLTFTLSTTSGVPVRAEIEQLFQSYMKNIGIKINIQNYSAATLFGTVAPKSEYDIIEFAWVATPFASSNQSIYCSYTNAGLCGQNWNHYTNSEVDKLFVQATSTLDPAKAATLYNQIDALLWKDLVTLPLFQQPVLTTWTSSYGNILPNPSSSGLTWNAQTWGVKAS
jgi:peptide/nickel transport system substrate-binding protein